MKPKSRIKRWAEAATKAEQAIEELIEIQSEFQDWRDNLPENLEASPVAEKLDAVIELDLEGAHEAVQEAEGVDLPLGFGRD